MFRKKNKELPPALPKKLLAVSSVGDDVIIEVRCNRKLWGYLAGWLGKGLGHLTSIGLAGVTSGLIVLNFYPSTTKANPPVETGEKVEETTRSIKK
jgi:hypothetical protein